MVVLYQWDEMMEYIKQEGVQGICPIGWHVTTDGEWKVLEGSVDSQFGVGDPIWDIEGWRGIDAGSNIKEAGTSHWVSPNAGATNSSGFTALPAGYRIGSGFYQLFEVATFWSSSVPNTVNAWAKVCSISTKI